MKWERERVVKAAGSLSVEETTRFLVLNLTPQLGEALSQHKTPPEHVGKEGLNSENKGKGPFLFVAAERNLLPSG